MDEEQVKSLLCRHTALQRMATPAEAANVIEFLLSDNAAYISDANIPVDGGLINLDGRAIMELSPKQKNMMNCLG